MKKWFVVFLAALFLAGCSAQDVFETVADEYVASAMAMPREISVRLPDGASSPVGGSDGAQIYLSEEYELIIETRSGGDFGATVSAISGFDPEDLTIVETRRDGIKRYDFVWTSAGEGIDRLGRGVILDDGTYHYCMTAIRNADQTNRTQIVWRDVFESFSLI